jgi:hypothetical protein
MDDLRKAELKRLRAPGSEPRLTGLDVLIRGVATVVTVAGIAYGLQTAYLASVTSTEVKREIWRTLVDEGSLGKSSKIADLDFEGRREANWCQVPPVDGSKAFVRDVDGKGSFCVTKVPSRMQPKPYIPFLPDRRYEVMVTHR